MYIQQCFLKISLLFATFSIFATFFETWEKFNRRGDRSPENVFRVHDNSIRRLQLCQMYSRRVCSQNYPTFRYFSLIVHFSLLFWKLGKNIIRWENVLQRMYSGCSIKCEDFTFLKCTVNAYFLKISLLFATFCYFFTFRYFFWNLGKIRGGGRFSRECILRALTDKNLEINSFLIDPTEESRSWWILNCTDGERTV